MKKSISVVTLFPGAGQYYAGQIRELFGDLVEVYSYSTSDRSVEKITRTDLYLVSTDAFKIAEEESQYVPADGQVVEIYVGYSKDVIRRLKEIPAGTSQRGHYAVGAVRCESASIHSLRAGCIYDGTDFLG